VIFCVKCCAVIRGERSPISSRSECCWASINCRLDLDALWETLPVFSDVPTRAFSLACTRRGGELIPSCLCAVQRFFLQLTTSAKPANPIGELGIFSLPRGSARENIEREKERAGESKRCVTTDRCARVESDFRCVSVQSSTCIEVHVEKTTRDAVRTPSSYRRLSSKLEAIPRAGTIALHLIRDGFVSRHRRLMRETISHLGTRILGIPFRGDFRRFPSHSPSEGECVRAREECMGELNYDGEFASLYSSPIISIVVNRWHQPSVGIFAAYRAEFRGREQGRKSSRYCRDVTGLSLTSTSVREKFRLDCTHNINNDLV